MAKLNRTLLATASALSLASLFAGSAQAGSLTNPVLSGGSSLTYCSNGSNTFESGTALGSCTLEEALMGNAGAPGGNAELNSLSESTASGGGIGTATTLSGDLNGTAISLSSLTADDWDAIGLEWFTALIAAATAGTGFTPGTSLIQMAYDSAWSDNNFVGIGGRERFSDPNISYVNQGADGKVKIGLAGHFNAGAVITAAIPSLGSYISDDFQASEIVKVT